MHEERIYPKGLSSCAGRMIAGVNWKEGPLWGIFDVVGRGSTSQHVALPPKAAPRNRGVYKFTATLVLVRRVGPRQRVGRQIRMRPAEIRRGGILAQRDDAAADGAPLGENVEQRI